MFADFNVWSVIAAVETADFCMIVRSEFYAEVHRRD